MSLEKVFNVKDKVFIRRRFYPAWPAIISSVNTNTQSQTTYNVYLYGTGDYIECKAELLIPYEENKSKMLKLNKKNRKYKLYVKALLEIENATDTFSENNVQVFSIPSNKKQIFHPDKSLDVSKDIDKIQLIDDNHLENKEKSKINVSSKFKKNKSINNMNFTISKKIKRKISEVQTEKCIKRSMIDKPLEIQSLKLNETQPKLNEENKSKVRKSQRKLIESDGLAKAVVLTEVENGIDSTLPSQESSNIEKGLPLDKFENIDKVNIISDCNSVIERELIVNKSNLSKKNKQVTTIKRRRKKKSNVKPKKWLKKYTENISQEIECLKENKSSVESNDVLAQSLENRSINVQNLHEMNLNEIQPIVLVEVLNDQLLAKATNENQSSKNDLNIEVDQNRDQNIHETRDKHAENICITKSTTESSNALLDNNKTIKFALKINDLNSLNNKRIASHLRHESIHTSKKIHFADYKKKSRHSLRSSIKMSKATKILNASDIETNDTMEQNWKTKDTSLNPETENTLESTPIPSLHINNSVSEETIKLSNKNNNSFSGLKEILTDFLSSLETKFKEQELDAKKIAQMELLQVEVDTLDCIHKLRYALSIKHFNYEMALQSLEQIKKLKINALMLIKHQVIVDTIIKVTKYVGNASEWKLSEQEAIKHSEEAAKVRHMAQTIHHKFVSLFTKRNVKEFKTIYDKRVDEFKTKTKDLDLDQIYGCTSIKP